MSRCRINPRAAEDLRSIARYTLETSGRAQRDINLSAIDRRFSWLAENPTLGKPRHLSIDEKDSHFPAAPAFS